MQHAPHKGFFTEIHVELARAVQLGILKTPAVINILQKIEKKIIKSQRTYNISYSLQNRDLYPMEPYLVKKAQAEDREGCVDQVVQSDEPLIIHSLVKTRF